MRKVSFKETVEPIINTIAEPNCPFYQQGIDALVKAMFHMKTLSKAILLLKTSKHVDVILDSIYKFSADAPPQKILAAHKAFVETLYEYLLSENTKIRHTVIGIFAECRKKIPKEFTFQMRKKFSPIQIRLVEIKAGRYRARSTNNF